MAESGILTRSRRRLSVDSDAAPATPTKKDNVLSHKVIEEEPEVVSSPSRAKTRKSLLESKILTTDVTDSPSRNLRNRRASTTSPETKVATRKSVSKNLSETLSKDDVGDGKLVNKVLKMTQLLTTVDSPKPRKSGKSVSDTESVSSVTTRRRSRRLSGELNPVKEDPIQEEIQEVVKPIVTTRRGKRLSVLPSQPSLPEENEDIDTIEKVVEVPEKEDIVMASIEDISMRNVSEKETQNESPLECIPNEPSLTTSTLNKSHISESEEIKDDRMNETKMTDSFSKSPRKRNQSSISMIESDDVKPTRQSINLNKSKNSETEEINNTSTSLDETKMMTDSFTKSPGTRNCISIIDGKIINLNRSKTSESEETKYDISNSLDETKKLTDSFTKSPRTKNRVSISSIENGQSINLNNSKPSELEGVNNISISNETEKITISFTKSPRTRNRVSISSTETEQSINLNKSKSSDLDGVNNISISDQTNKTTDSFTKSPRTKNQVSISSTETDLNKSKPSDFDAVNISTLNETTRKSNSFTRSPRTRNQISISSNETDSKQVQNSINLSKSKLSNSEDISISMDGTEKPVDDILKNRTTDQLLGFAESDTKQTENTTLPCSQSSEKTHSKKQNKSLSALDETITGDVSLKRKSFTRSSANTPTKDETNKNENTPVKRSSRINHEKSPSFTVSPAAKISEDIVIKECSIVTRSKPDSCITSTPKPPVILKQITEDSGNKNEDSIMDLHMSVTNESAMSSTPRYTRSNNASASTNLHMSVTNESAMSDTPKNAKSMNVLEKSLIKISVDEDDEKETPKKDRSSSKLNTSKSVNVSKKDKSAYDSAISDTSTNKKNDSESSEEDSDMSDYKDIKMVFVDEASDAGMDYESGDSKDEDLKDIENEIPIKGISLNSEDSLEEDDDDTYEKDSFLCSSNEEDEQLLSGSGDDLSLGDNELTQSKESKAAYDKKQTKIQKNASREMYQARHSKSPNKSTEEATKGFTRIKSNKQNSLNGIDSDSESSLSEGEHVTYIKKLFDAELSKLKDNNISKTYSSSDSENSKEALNKSETKDHSLNKVKSPKDSEVKNRSKTEKSGNFDKSIDINGIPEEQVESNTSRVESKSPKSTSRIEPVDSDIVCDANKSVTANNSNNLMGDLIDLNTPFSKKKPKSPKQSMTPKEVKSKEDSIAEGDSNKSIIANSLLVEDMGSSDISSSIKKLKSPKAANIIESNDLDTVKDITETLDLNISASKKKLKSPRPNKEPGNLSVISNGLDKSLSRKSPRNANKSLSDHEIETKNASPVKINGNCESLQTDSRKSLQKEINSSLNVTSSNSKLNVTVDLSPPKTQASDLELSKKRANDSDIIKMSKKMKRTQETTVTSPQSAKKLACSPLSENSKRKKDDFQIADLTKSTEKPKKRKTSDSSESMWSDTAGEFQVEKRHKENPSKPITASDSGCTTHFSVQAFRRHPKQVLKVDNRQTAFGAPSNFKEMALAKSRTGNESQSMAKINQKYNALKKRNAIR